MFVRIEIFAIFDQTCQVGKGILININLYICAIVYMIASYCDSLFESSMILIYPYNVHQERKNSKIWILPTTHNGL